MKNRFGLIGKTLHYSLSKEIHERIFRSNGYEYQYDLIELSESEFANFMSTLRNSPYQGLNVTTPYKMAVIPYLDVLSERAKVLGNVNTIYYRDGLLYGDNTDYLGLEALFNHFKIEVKGKNYFVLGSGGAAHTAFYLGCDLGASKVKMVSRTKEDANTISYQKLASEDIDILINATPLGMKNKLVPVSDFVIKKARQVIDLNYNPLETELLKKAHSKMNGLYMLLYQAYYADRLWLGELKVDILKLYQEVGALLE